MNGLSLPERLVLEMRNLSLPHHRYLKVLQRQRDRILNGIELNYFDCTEHGDQDNQVSWGLCSRDKEVWPDPEDHLWPDEFIQNIWRLLMESQNVVLLMMNQRLQN